MLSERPSQPATIDDAELEEPRTPSWLPFLGGLLFLAGVIVWLLLREPAGEGGSMPVGTGAESAALQGPDASAPR